MERLVLEGKATRHEIQTHWSIDDLADANDALDAWYEAKARAEKKVKR